MQAQKHSSSPIGWRCQQSRRPSWRPREGENMVGRLGEGSCAGVFKVKKNGGLVTEIVLLGCFGMFVVRLMVYDPLTG